MTEEKASLLRQLCPALDVYKGNPSHGTYKYSVSLDDFVTLGAKYGWVEWFGVCSVMCIYAEREGGISKFRWTQKVPKIRE